MAIQVRFASAAVCASTAPAANHLSTDARRPGESGAAVRAAPMSGVRSALRLRRLQLKGGDLGGPERREATQGVLTRSSDSQTPMRCRAPSPIAQRWRGSPARVAPSRLMINACALSSACLNFVHGTVEARDQHDRNCHSSNRRTVRIDGHADRRGDSRCSKYGRGDFGSPT